MEDYLEMIGFLTSEEGSAGVARVTDIATRLGVSKPSVLTALKTLERRGYVEHERYRGVTLTVTGRRRSAEIRSRHEFLTAFLKDVVGVDQETAEQDACKMEHILSEKTLERMRAIASCSDDRSSEE